MLGWDAIEAQRLAVVNTYVHAINLCGEGCGNFFPTASEVGDPPPSVPPKRNRRFERSPTMSSSYSASSDDYRSGSSSSTPSTIGYVSGCRAAKRQARAESNVFFRNTSPIGCVWISSGALTVVA